MKPTKIDQERDDDCFRACLAMVCGVPIHEVPEPVLDDQELFWGVYHKWANDRGLRLIYSGTEYGRSFPTEGLWIASVPSFCSKHREGHAVVMDGERLFHDPSTGRKRRRRPTKIYSGIEVIVEPPISAHKSLEPSCSCKSNAGDNEECPLHDHA